MRRRLRQEEATVHGKGHICRVEIEAAQWTYISDAREGWNMSARCSYCSFHNARVRSIEAFCGLDQHRMELSELLSTALAARKQRSLQPRFANDF